MLLNVCMLELADAAQKYETGISNIARITTDLRNALPPQTKAALAANPLIVEPTSIPSIQPCQSPQQNAVAVQFTTGFIDLLNYVSHAQAINEEQPGFLRRALEQLRARHPEVCLSDLHSQPPAKAWSFDTLNHQVSYFNQMAGALMAIQFAHHYLGHYDKYGTSARGLGSTPLYQVLTAEEWHAAVLKGARNALDCGFMVEGLKAFYTALDAMPQRPGWTLYFMPAKANVSRLKRDLAKVQDKFFAYK